MISMVPADKNSRQVFVVTSHRCPVCNGNGLVAAGFYAKLFETWINAGGTETCRSCAGTGVVWHTGKEVVE